MGERADDPAGAGEIRVRTIGRVWGDGSVIDERSLGYPRDRVSDYLVSLQPGCRAASAEVEIALASCAMPTMDEGDAHSVAAAAAVLLARTRRGSRDRLESDRYRVEAAADAASDTSAHILAQVYAALAECALYSCDSVAAARLAGQAMERARGSSSLSARAVSLMCVAHALNGDYTSAIEYRARARRAQRVNGWSADAAFYPLVLGEVMLSSSRLDVAGLRRCEADLDRGAADVVASATLEAVRAMRHLLLREFGDAIARARPIADHAELQVPPAIVGFAAGIVADALIVRGDAHRALDYLRGRVSPPSHMLCFDMQRSAALLQLDRPAEALAVTAECVRPGAAHCRRTLAPILLRRALAYLRLGQRVASRDSFDEAFAMLVESGSATPLLTLPQPQLSVLLEDVSGGRSPISSHALRLSDRLADVPFFDAPSADAVSSFAVPLTAREERLIDLLATELTLTEIAGAFFVRPSTLKAQLRAVYAKLGVSSRREAVAAVERELSA